MKLSNKSEIKISLKINGILKCLKLFVKKSIQIFGDNQKSLTFATAIEGITANRKQTIP